MWPPSKMSLSCLHFSIIQIEGKGNYAIYDHDTVGLTKIIHGIVSVFL
jgi:hypothetical protein